MLVGSLYAVVGGFFLFLPLITWLIGTQVNDTPPPAPSPIPEVLGRLSIWMNGPLDAVVVVGAGMVVCGLLVLGRQYRDRSAARSSQPLPGVGAQPIRP